MTRFPSDLRDTRDAGLVLARACTWSDGLGGRVRITGLDLLRTHVREIDRSPSSGRIGSLPRLLDALPDPGASTDLPADVAGTLFSACLCWSAPLLELGFPPGEPPGFHTRLPSPGVSPRRTHAQMRSAMHHLGGDFGLLRSLLVSGASSDPSLRLSMRPWPVGEPGERILLELRPPSVRLPATMLLEPDLRGYVLLAAWDLALRLAESDGVPVLYGSFEDFVVEAG